MGQHFENAYIDILLAALDLTDIMEQHGVQVKRGTGNNDYYVADFCCGKTDFDNGRINKSTQTYRCMACQNEHKNAIHFLREVQGLSFFKAIETLSEISGIPLPENKEESQEELRKQQALQLAADFFHEQGNFDYFLSRGISMEVLMKHKAGYAPGGRELRNHLQKHGFTKKELEEYKLIHPNKGLDTLFYRAIIPIYMNGKVVDFYGRATDDNRAAIKHFYLYGNISFLGGYDHLQSGKLVSIYESYIDQLVAETHGYVNSTNVGGAGKFTPEHARLLQRKGIETVVVVYDGDAAGKKGALETGEMLDAAQINTHIGTLPEGLDPAEVLSTQGQEKFKSLLDVRTYRQMKMYSLLGQYSLQEIKEYVAEMESKT